MDRRSVLRQVGGAVGGTGLAATGLGSAVQFHEVEIDGETVLARAHLTDQQVREIEGSDVTSQNCGCDRCPICLTCHCDPEDIVEENRSAIEIV